MEIQKEVKIMMKTLLELTKQNVVVVVMAANRI